MKGFAYIDKYGILHAAGSKETAEKYSSNGKIEPTDLADGGGYINENEMNVFIDSGNYWHGKNRNKENQLTAEQFKSKYPQTYAIYQKVK